MRILHWTDNFLPNLGGVETFVRDLALTQREGGHEPVILTMRHVGCPTEGTWDGLPVWRRPFCDDLYATAPRELGGAVRWCMEFRRNLKPDVVHLHLSRASSFYETLSRSAWPCPVVATPHGPFEHIPQPMVMKRRVLGEASVVTGISVHCAEILERQLDRKVTVVLNGVRLATPLGPMPAEVPPRVLGVGRMVEEKGFDVAVRALIKVPGARLTLAGDGPARLALEQLAVACGVADRVEFTGWLEPDAVAGLIATCHVVVMPSRWQEPFGLVAVQAGMMARPVVASRVGGLPEIVVEGETGRLVAPNDPEALAAAVAGLLADPVRAAAMGEAARRRVEAEFSIERCAAGYEAVYRVAIEGRVRQ